MNGNITNIDNHVLYSIIYDKMNKDRAHTIGQEHIAYAPPPPPPPPTPPKQLFIELWISEYKNNLQMF